MNRITFTKKIMTAERIDLNVKVESHEKTDTNPSIL